MRAFPGWTEINWRSVTSRRSRGGFNSASRNLNSGCSILWLLKTKTPSWKPFSLWRFWPFWLFRTVLFHIILRHTARRRPEQSFRLWGEDFYLEHVFQNSPPDATLLPQVNKYSLSKLTASVFKSSTVKRLRWTETGGERLGKMDGNEVEGQFEFTTLCCEHISEERWWEQTLRQSNTSKHPGTVSVPSHLTISRFPLGSGTIRKLLFIECERQHGLKCSHRLSGRKYLLLLHLKSYFWPCLSFFLWLNHQSTSENRSQ